MTFRVSAEASRDLDEIFLYWAARAGVPTAGRIIDAITRRFWLVGEYPDAGRRVPDLGAGLKCFPAGDYLIYYRKSSDTTEILHIFHGAREQQRALKKSRKSR